MKPAAAPTRLPATQAANDSYSLGALCEDNSFSLLLLLLLTICSITLRKEQTYRRAKRVRTTSCGTSDCGGSALPVNAALPSVIRTEVLVVFSVMKMCDSGLLNEAIACSSSIYN